LVNDRRFASRGFKRQTPVGPHICDFVSFPLRVVIDLLPAHEEPAAAKARADKHAWLAERDYKIVTLAIGLVETDVAAALDQVDQIIG
jgi:tRNA/rRNA methyltransferase